MMPRRLVQLYVGLALFGVSMAFLVRAQSGLAARRHRRRRHGALRAGDRPTCALLHPAPDGADREDPSMPRLLIVIAGTRPGRRGAAVADWFAAVAREHGGFDVEIADLAEVDLPLLNEPNDDARDDYVHEHTKRWSATVASADAVVFVMPEYNRTFTAPLKNALDYLY